MDCCQLLFYSHTVDSIAVEIPYGEFYKNFKVAGKTHVIDLKIGSKNTIPCIVHDLDIHPVTGNVRHVDFLAVNLKEKVVASVPLNYVGESNAVKQLGGVLNTTLNEISVSALPDNIPDEVVVDISKIETFSDVIKISDLLIDKNYSILGDSEIVLVSVTQATQEQTDDIESSVVVEEPAK
jgi:large subunit ribosomal protein L25